MCVLIAPGVFDQDTEDGRVVLLNRAPASDQGSVVREAAQMCPSGAITLVSGDWSKAPAQQPQRRKT